MKKKIIILVICTILVIFLFGVVFFNKDKKSDKTENSNKYSVIYDNEGNIIYDMSKKDETTEVIKDTVIQGIVELNHNGYIYIFNGQHFGEFGFEMKEYTRANINNKNQKCLDYFTLKEYDTNYIQEGDILICSGDLSKKGYGMGENDFDTKDNSIIVLKSNDYNQMKRDALTGKRTYSSIVTIGNEYVELGYVYLKYSLEDDTYSDTGYNFPFAVKAYITENTEIIGNLQREKIVKVQYEDLNLPLDELKIKLIEVIEE
jgi:hypothetical protein